ncbi:MAG: hypothetical protein HZB14_01385 [Actinobacteria bacterium]|nr:hypothetical protein [Actinomycetota bacterium]
MKSLTDNAARVFQAGCLALLIALLIAIGPSARPASAANWYQVNVCADPGWLQWVTTMPDRSTDWLLAGSCRNDGSEWAIDFWTEAEPLDVGEEMAWIYPNRFGFPRAGLTIGEARVILAGNNGSNAGAIQGVRFCNVTCGELITLSQTSLPEGQYEPEIVLSPGDPGLPVGATEMRFSAHCTELPCGPTQKLKILKLLLKFEDDVRPTGRASTVGPGATSPAVLGWMAQQFQYRWNAEDADSGVRQVTVSKKGSTTPVHVPTLPVPCFSFAFAGLCRTTAQALHTINPADGIWNEGLNEVYIDVDDRAGNRSIRAAAPDMSFYVDRRSPTPEGLAVSEATPSGWVRDSSVTLDWVNNGETAESRSLSDPHSGVVAAEYDFQPRGSQPNPAPQRIEGAAINTAAVTISSPGGWDVVVRTIDAVGNRSAPMTTFVGLDSAIPPAPQIDPIGWVGSAQLLDGHVFTWTKPASTASGTCGYGYSVDELPDSDAPTAMTIDGDVAQAELPNGSIDGSRYLHLRAISCAGVPGETAHLRFEADLTPPRAHANLTDQSWTADSTALRIAATDEGSGVQDVRVKVGDSTTVHPGTEAVPELHEGEHMIEFSASDVAGNVSQPESLRIGVDRSAPGGLFESPSSDHPTLLAVTVVDELSGVRDGAIEYRPAGGIGEWTELTTDPDFPVGNSSVAKLNARFPDASQPEGAYELRARVVDNVGNVSYLTNRWDGAPATIVTPVRGRTEMTLAFEKQLSSRCAKKPARRCKSVLTMKEKTVDFGRGAMVVGRLAGPEGEPVPGQTVKLLEQRTETKTRVEFASVRTDSDGRFRVHVKPGVNRRIIARFDRHELLKTAEDSVLFFTRSKLTLRASNERVRRGGRLIVSGRLYTGGERIVLGRPVHVMAVGTSWSIPVSVGPDGYFREMVPTGRRGLPVRLMLQARIQAQDGWPYHAGRSRVVRVTIVP